MILHASIQTENKRHKHNNCEKTREMCRICVKLKHVVDSSSKCLEINLCLLIIKIQGFQRKTPES